MFLFCAVCVPSRVRRLLLVSSLVWIFAALFGRVFWLRVSGGGFQTQRKKSWVLGKIMAEKVWKMPSRLMAGKNESVCSVLRQTRGPDGVAGGVSETFLQVRIGSTRKPSLRKTKSDIQGLRAQVELLSKPQGVWPDQDARGPRRRGSGLEEDCKIEVEEETDCKNKLNERKKSLQRQLRDIKKFASTDPVFRDRQQEIWKQGLQGIERKGTELLWEHLKMQKRSQKLQSLQDKQRNHLKNACACEKEMQMLNKEMEERKALHETRFQASSEMSGYSRRSRPCRRAKKEEAAVCRNPMDAASIQSYWSRSSLLEKNGQKTLSISCSRSLSGCTGPQAVQGRRLG